MSLYGNTIYCRNSNSTLLSITPMFTRLAQALHLAIQSRLERTAIMQTPMDPRHYLSHYLSYLGPERCGFCDKEQPANKCDSCKITLYCNSDCQQQHLPKYCAICKQQKGTRNYVIQDCEEIKGDGTQLFIVATRLAVGDVGNPPIRDFRTAIDIQAGREIDTAV